MAAYSTINGPTTPLNAAPPRGVAVVELLVSITVVVSLISLIVPSLLYARAIARRASCMNNLKQLTMAMQNYESQHGTFPPGYVYRSGLHGENTAGFGWCVILLPQLDHSPLYQQIDWSQPLSSPVHDTLRMAKLSVVQCSADRSHALSGIMTSDVEYATGNYVANFGSSDMHISSERGDGMFSRNSAVRPSEVTDGMAHTLLVGERLNETFLNKQGDTVQCLTAWSGTGPSPVDPGREAAEFVLFRTGHVPASRERDHQDASSAHPESCCFGMADGSVRFLNSAIDTSIYQALSTRSGEELNGRLPPSK